MLNKPTYIIFILLLWPVFTTAQNTKKKGYSENEKSSKSAVIRLSKSLESEKSNEEVANNYVTLAKEFYGQGNYAKAENNLQQAIYLYKKEKVAETLAETYRELAKSQEMQEKFTDAITNYTNAAKISQQKEFRDINTNDANRLQNRTNLKVQSGYIQKNIELSKTAHNKEEAVTAHQQMAQVKKMMNDNKGAVDELKSALEITKDKPEEVIKIKQDIADTYASDEQYDKAIDITKSLVTEAQKISNPQVEVKQLKSLAHTYIAAKEKNKGIQTLQQAYELAMQNSQTLEARNTLRELANYYRESKESAKALNLYADFVYRLDTLIRSDSTLIDEKFFQLHEERINRLENERALKDELIASTNTLNYLLIGILVLILIFLAFITKTLYSINKKNKKIALQSLRREMNPHFIFNSLNSVNQFIAQNNELEANKYLSSYSKLMRNMMENSNKDFITLATETEQLKKYLELEHLRFQDKFTYEINIDRSLDLDTVYIPNMIIQPQLENAIWHGLRYKENGGMLILRIEKNEDQICITIEDNGIGLRQSQELKTKHQKQHHSRGLTNTRERIRLLNELYHTHISMKIEEKENSDDNGVIVTLIFPWIDKKQTKQ